MLLVAWKRGLDSPWSWKNFRSVVMSRTNADGNIQGEKMPFDGINLTECKFVRRIPVSVRGRSKERCRLDADAEKGQEC